jgi:hypothetical protein
MVRPYLLQRRRLFPCAGVHQGIPVRCRPIGDLGNVGRHQQACADQRFRRRDDFLHVILAALVATR